MEFLKEAALDVGVAVVGFALGTALTLGQAVHSGGLTCGKADQRIEVSVPAK